jgi:2'-5' RNA ligase
MRVAQATWKAEKQLTFMAGASPEAGALEDSIEAVVSFLDEAHDEKVRGLWARLEENFGLQGIYSAPFPHFSYHGAKAYDKECVENLLECVSKDSAPFVVRSTGLGLFHGEKPVLFIPVVRSAQVDGYHQKFWLELADTATKPNPHYQPDRWLPHITLAYGDLTEEVLPEVIRFLSEQNFNWEIPIDNLALVYAAGQDQGVKCRVVLGEGNQKSQIENRKSG